MTDKISKFGKKIFDTATKDIREDFNKKVENGELIYVNNYVRSDGTKVSGYYRRIIKY